VVEDAVELDGRLKEELEVMELDSEDEEEEEEEEVLLAMLLDELEETLKHACGSGVSVLM
jgi:hypothetical protein